MNKERVSFVAAVATVAAAALFTFTVTNRFHPGPAGPTSKASESIVAAVSLPPEPSAPAAGLEAAAAAAPSTESPGRPAQSEAIGQFRDWLSRYQQAGDGSTKTSLEAEGEALAGQRREAMARLIETDPQRALEEAVSYELRQQLPASIAASLERPVSGRGTLDVLGVLPEPDAEGQTAGIIRTAHLGGTDYRAFVYGRRLAQPTTQNIPLHGIAIGDALALHESPVRVLNAHEAAAVLASNVTPQGENCPVSGRAISPESADAVVDVGGQIRLLCNGGHIVQLENELLAAEGTGTGEVAASGPLDTWSQGPKTMLYIRVRFSDQTSDPQTLTDAQNMMASVDSFFREGSYETTSITTTFTPVYTLAGNTAYYVTNDIYKLRTDALAAAKAGGYDSVNWNLDAVRYNGGPGSFAGAAYVHARGCWLKSSSAGVAAHEFGHNYGLYHANSWNPSDASPIGPGTWEEYGDSFDTMGSASAGANHYSARYKSVLNWMPADSYLSATASGTYRVYAHDSITSSNLIRGLRVPFTSTKNYWVDFRQKFTGNQWMMNGASLRRADNSNNNNPGSELLDTTPGSPDGKTDSALLIGRTFSDSNTSVHITPIAKGGTIPESLDVVVNIGPFPGNNAPSLDISSSSTAVPTGTPIAFTATASDANGDSLAYFWDFGDKSYGLNAASMSKSWNTIGEYVVNCVVSDMKGGTASRWMVVTVGSPSTFRLTGRVTDANGNPLQGVRVHNGKTSSLYRGCFTDVDGNYCIANLASGSYTVGAAFYGYTLALSGFSNPVSVGPSKSGLNFVGTVKTYSISGSVTDGGLPVANVQVSDGSRTAVSDANGNYVIANVQSGSYTLTATKPGSAFNPSGWSNPVAVNDANVTSRNFITPTYTVSGEITGVSATTIVTVTDGYRTTTSYKQGGGANAKNVYSLSGVPAGSWNIRAILPGSSFSSAGFTNPLNVTGNTSGRNFALDPIASYSISGSATWNGIGLSGVTVSAGSRNSLTDSRGGYFIRGLSNGAYDVVPSLGGYAFTPASTAVTVAGADLGGKNFTASQIILPSVTVVATDADASEPGNAGAFTVTRSGAGTGADLTVSFTVGGTATSTADYVPLSGSVLIPAGSSTATITVTPVEDAESECPETVVVTLTASSTYVLGSPASATATMTDNDLPAVSVAAIGSSAWENGGGSLTFRATRSGCLTSPLAVSYGLSGTATAGADYQSLSGSVTIPAGANSATITVTPTDDPEIEGDETVVFAVLTSASYTVGSPASATGVIIDNESNHAPQVNAGADQSTSILGLASLSGSATDDGLPGSALTYAWSKVSGPGTIAAANPNAKDTAANFSMTGTYVLRLTVSDGELSASDDVSITVTAADPAKVLNAVNTGGPGYTNAQGIVYRADALFDGGDIASVGTAIGATADSALYQTERFGDFAYDIPVSGGNQTYLVALKFAETGATAPGQRLFDVWVDGNLKIQNLDLYAQAGANTAFDLIMPVTTSGDVLNIQFQTANGSALSAKVNAIVVGAAQVLSPAAPDNLSATAASGSRIDLSWDDNSANETSFQIEVSMEGSTYLPLVTVGANVTSYSHVGLNPATTYHYRVRACNAAGCSSFGMSSATTLDAAPAAPGGLVANAQSGSQINLSWVDNSSNEDGFVIERSLNGATFEQIATLAANQTTYASTGLKSNTRYYFRMRAFNELGLSAASNTVNVRTKAK